MDYNSILRRIVSGEFTNIVVLTGAGISISAGIPDYRANDSIYAKLVEEFPDIMNVSQLFTRKQFDRVRKHPLVIAEILRVKNAKPTPSHLFCSKLHHFGLLRRVYTQNIDGLHNKAGLPDDKVVVCCDNPSPKIWLKIQEDFIDNPIPVDLIIVMGASLKDLPFCVLPNLPSRYCPRVLVDKCPATKIINDYASHHKITIGNRTVTLRSKWKENTWEKYIFTMDTDVWVSKGLEVWG